MDENDRAIADIELFIDSSIKKFKSVFKGSVKDLGVDLVDATPRYFAHEPSSGNTAANWNISEGSPDDSYNESIADFDGGRTKSEIRRFVQSTKVTDNTVFYLTNASPSIQAIEYGLYPTPVQKGSWNSQTKSHEIRSAGGYSLQAPLGIGIIAELRWDEIVKNNMAKRDVIE